MSEIRLGEGRVQREKAERKKCLDSNNCLEANGTFDSVHICPISIFSFCLSVEGYVPELPTGYAGRDLMTPQSPSNKRMRFSFPLFMADTFSLFPFLNIPKLELYVS